MWLPLSLLAPLLWAASNLIDGELVRLRRSALSLCCLTGLSALLPAAAIALLHHPAWTGWWPALVAVFVGAISVLSYYPYFRAMETAHPVSTVLIWNLAPVLVAGGAVAFVGERLHPLSYIAVLALTMSAVIGAVPNDARRASLRAAGWMLLASLAVAIEALLQKWLYLRLPVPTGLAWMLSGSGATAIAMFFVLPSVREEVRDLINGRLAKVVILNETLNVGGALCATVAIGLGPVSLVKAIGGLQPLGVLLFGHLAQRHLRIRAPMLMAKRPSLVQVLFATALAAIGLALLGLE